MSSRQINWLREQLRKKRGKQEEPIDPEDGRLEIQTPSHDLRILFSSDDSSPLSPLPIAEVTAPAPVKRAPKPAVDDEAEYSALLALSRAQRSESRSKPPDFSIQSLNLVREINSTIGPTRFDECLKLPKQPSPLRFMSRLKKWPQTVPPYFDFVKQSDHVFCVDFTDFGREQSSIYHAFARMNDATSLLELGRTSHFVPPILPIACQSLLFDREFDSATEVALRGFYILQMSLPPGFIPLQTRLAPSPARGEFLDLIAFLARFSFRRNCFQTSSALWRFGLELTDDDPENFALLAAVPALYAGNAAYVASMLDSERTWREVPLRQIPDWALAHALLNIGDIEGLAREIAKWPFVFDEYGLPCDVSPTPVLTSLASAFRRRTAAFCEKEEIATAIATAADLARLLDESDAQAIAMSFWFEIEPDDIEFGAMVEEALMPAG